MLEEQTLQSWAHLSLKQRAIMFHRRFPEVKISASTLARFYQANGIRYKYIQREKQIIDYSVQHYLDIFKKLWL